MAFITRDKKQSTFMNNSLWTRDSWRQKEAKQLPNYPDHDQLTSVVSQLKAAPPLVVPFEVDRLKKQLADAAMGKAFLLQGGDCAERFLDSHPDVITRKLKILLQMSTILLYRLRKPIIRVGRIAGQYAKPRSHPFETRDGLTLPSYQGDSVNHPAFDQLARTPDPTLLLKAYQHSAQTLNYVRALVQHGFADLHYPEYWDIDFIQHSPSHAKYKQLLTVIADAIEFVETVAGNKRAEFSSVDFFTAHEALLLPYEEALTHQYKGQWYNLSTHFPWIGMRTVQLDSAHVEYCRGIANPIAIKVGPMMNPVWLTELVHKLNPANEPGRLTLIHRLGADQIETKLPPLINAVKSTGKTVLWCSDPMHGNTEITKHGIKTRHFDTILKELRLSFAVHKKMNSYLGGVHFELTGDNVTECTGGARGLTADDLQQAYKSLIDPRLNGEQALEMAMLILDCA